MPYCEQELPAEVLEKLQAAAFRSLCQHLQERSDQVANMDLMALSGFCRNCLAKWMVLAARNMVDKDDSNDALPLATRQSLDQMGYGEAAEHVYGMTYDTWKARHQKKATPEQLQAYQDSQQWHARHNKGLLEKRSTTDATANNASTRPNDADAATTTTKTVPLASNVCCQPEETLTSQPRAPVHGTRTLPPWTPPPLPSDVPSPLLVGVLTVSDRASRGQYATGDLSGPAVVEAIEKQMMDAQEVDFQTAIVPDEADQIQSQLGAWGNQVHLVITTGGTGFGPRDVTPEATRAAVSIELPQLMTFITTESSKVQPLSSLSRGTAGILADTPTLVANLPGNPKAVHELMPLVWSLLLHAVVELQE